MVFGGCFGQIRLGRVFQIDFMQIFKGNSIYLFLKINFNILKEIPERFRSMAN